MMVVCAMIMQVELHDANALLNVYDGNCGGDYGIDEDVVGESGSK